MSYEARFKLKVVEFAKKQGNRATVIENTDTCVIPGGLTSQLQPLDVSINKPFKEKMRLKWTEWLMDSTRHTFTVSGSLRKPDITTVCTWIKESWDELAPGIITRSFNKCSISNVLDGSEDHLIYYEDDSADGDDDPFHDILGSDSENDMK